jgi:hypothetical protein
MPGKVLRHGFILLVCGLQATSVDNWEELEHCYKVFLGVIESHF